MKIYYKKRFYSGLFSLLLGLANPVTCLLRGWGRFDWKEKAGSMPLSVRRQPIVRGGHIHRSS